MRMTITKENLKHSTRNMEGDKYFISAFLEVEKLYSDSDSMIARDLRRAGNLFDNEDDARKALHFLKVQIGRYVKTIHDLC